MPLPSRRILFPLLLAAVASAAPASAGDWVHWRGPAQTGESKDTGLPDWFDDKDGGENLIWKAPYGGRSAPLVLNGRVYTIGGYDMSRPTEGERILCFDADTGKLLWEKRFNVFHTDIVSSRLGWTTLTADPDKEHIFAHTTGGFLYCLDQDGKEVWVRHLTEEFGRITGYGGRNVSPLYDSGLVVLGLVNASWGGQGRGANRFVAFDAANGEIVWWADTVGQVKGTYYSTPIVCVVNGVKILAAGGADGYVYGYKLRTGEPVFRYEIAAGTVNPSAVASGSKIYFCHGEENPGGGTLGRIVCVDASQIDPKTLAPKVVWEYRKSNRFGLASPALADGLLYVPDDSAEVYCFDAETGKKLWDVSYGTVARGAPLIADGRMYIFDVNAKLSIYELNGKKPPEELDPVPFRKTQGAGFVETHGTPVAANGKIYFETAEFTYCIGTGNGKAADSAAYPPLPAETAFDESAKPTAIRVFPADVAVKPGQTVPFQVVYLDANGRTLPAPKDAKVEWSFPLPAKTPTGAQPPALKATADGTGTTTTVTIDKLPRQQGELMATADGLTAQARIRVVPQIPYTEDFEKVPVGGVPSGWINVAGKFSVVEKDGSKVLLKRNDSPNPILARANGFITTPNAADYTIVADMTSSEVRGKVGDMGVVNSRYILTMDGKVYDDGKRRLQLVSWEARMRVNESAVMDWKPDVWYTVKMQVVPEGKTNTVRCKAWPRAEPEPAAWMIEFHDPSPNNAGAAAIYGYVPNVADTLPGSEILFDNVNVTPNAK